MTTVPDSSPSVTINTQSQLMQNYRVAAAVNAGSDVVAIQNAAGQVELFSLGTDNNVYDFYPDPASDTGYSSTPTGLSGTTLAVGQDRGGNLVVFAGSGTSVFYVVEINDGTQRWSAPAALAVPTSKPPIQIAGLYTAQVAGGFYLAALTSVQSVSPGATYYLSYLAWGDAHPAFTKTPFAIDTTHCVWSGNAPQNLTFLAVDTVLVGYTVATGQVVRFAMPGTFDSLGVAAVNDTSGNTQVFAILKDGNAYQLIDPDGTQYSWSQLSRACSFTQIAAELDGGGGIHLFALSAGKVVNHWQPNSASVTGFDPPAAILPGAGLIDVAQNETGAIDVFAVAATGSGLTHLYLEEESGNWAVQAIEVETGGAVEELISYCTDVTLFDADGILLPNVAAAVYAAEEAFLTINGATYTVGPRQPAAVVTTAAGKVSIAVQTGLLATPTIEIAVPSLMPTGATLAIQPNAGVQAELATLTGTELMDATDATGQPILTGRYRTPETADSVAKAVNQCMTLTGTVESGDANLFARQRPQPGVRLRPSRVGDLRRARLETVPRQHWQLSFDGGRAIYRTLGADEARGLLTEKRRALFSSDGVFDWLDDIGDFIAGVFEGIVEVIDVVVSTIGDAVQAAITFVADSVTYLFESTVELIEQAFDLVQAIFAQVVIAFEQLFEWLGFVFDWPDVLRTHQAISYAVKQLMGFLTGAAGGLQAAIDAGFATAQAQVQTFFSAAIQAIGDASTLQQVATDGTPASATFDTGISNNVVYDNTVANAANATMTGPAPGGNDPLSVFMADLATFAAGVQSNQGFTDALTYFQNLGGSPDQIAAQTMAGMLSAVLGIVEAAMTGAQAVVDGLLQLAQSLIAAIEDLLNAEWNIPFVSQFYAWLTDGAALTTLDLVALIVAVPTTILYKLTYGAAPFPDDASVAAFEQGFTSQTMLAAAGFATQPGERRQRAAAALAARGDDPWTGILPQSWATFLAVGTCAAQFFYSGLSAALDGTPPVEGEPPNKLFTQLTLVGEAITQVLSFPWFTSAGSLSCSTSDGWSRWDWMYGSLGVLLDLAFFDSDGAFPENDDDVGVTVAEAYGVIHLIPVLGVILAPGGTATAIASSILPLVPELSKVLRYSSIVLSSGGASLGVLAAIDAIFGTAAAVVEFVDATQPVQAGALPAAVPA